MSLRLAILKAAVLFFALMVLIPVLVELVLSAAASNQRALSTDAAGSRDAETLYALPVEHVTRIDLDGRQLLKGDDA